MCINFLRRSYKKEYYFFCRRKKKKIQREDCKNCQYKEYKKVNKIKNKTNKLKRIESKRFSIITNDFKNCYLCPGKKDDKHELIGGCNRQTSMKWGLVIPICRNCHSNLEVDINANRELEKLGQRAFEEKYGHELFMQEFKKNYL